MRTRPLTSVATVIAVASLSLLLSTGPAHAAWTWVSTTAFQIQHVCRDGIVLDLASDLTSPVTVHVAEPGDAVPPTVFYSQRFSLPKMPVLPEQGSDYFQSLGRNYKVNWKTLRVPGSQVQVTTGDPTTYSSYTVGNCLVNDVFDPFRVGYVLAHKPTGSYTPGSYWSHNSRMQHNTVSWLGVGSYAVDFPGLATAGGNAQVTAFGSAAANCKVGGSRWRPMGTGTRLYVRCFTPAGAPVNARFSASFTAVNGGSGNTIAFAWADQASIAGPYQPKLAYQHNNRGGAISVTRWAVGGYLVTMPDVFGAAPAGSVKVTAVGNGPNACKVQSWGPNFDSSAQQVWVGCSAPNGAAADEQFTIAYVDEMNLLGNNRMSYGYVWADSPLSTSYTPSPFYQRDANITESGTVTITRAGTGAYDVLLPFQTGSRNAVNVVSWDGGNVQVTAYGFDQNRCQIGSWQDDVNWWIARARVVRVYCFTTAGTPVDSMFTMQYTALLQ
jgi:hypothetical protein